LFGKLARRNLIFGTDEQGRDQFSRLLHGGRISLSIGLVGIAITARLLVAFLAGYGGWVDGVVMRLVEVLMTIPSIYLPSCLGGSVAARTHQYCALLLIVLITSFIGWAGLARVTGTGAVD